MDEKLDIKRVKEWLNQKWKGAKRCPICDRNSWGIGETLVEIREFHGEGLAATGLVVYPLVAVTCGVCGYTLLFNAIVADLVKAEPEKAPLPAAADEPKEAGGKGL